MKIAIVGTGISGLTAARHLHAEHGVTLFEANAYIGGHTHTEHVEVDGERQAVNTGFIVYNQPNYPEFSRMLGELGVETQPTEMSFSVRCDRTGLEYNGTDLNRLFAQRRNLFRPRFWRLVRDILRFNREAVENTSPDDETTTVHEFVRERGYGESFVEHYLVPMGAALWSCPPDTFRNFPIRFVVDFFRNHSLLQVDGRPVWRVIAGGSERYVEKMTAPFRDRIRLRTPVRRVDRHDEGITVTTDRVGRESFDHVIFACHADQALSILASPTPREQELLASFPYQANRVVLHTDTSVLPRLRRAWASWNYHVRENAPDRSTVTYDMNILQGLESRHTFLVTLNEEDGIHPDRILRRYLYHHPVYTAGRTKAQARHGEVLNRNRTSFCGAYWGYGFHEDGVASALRVCRALDGAREPEVAA